MGLLPEERCKSEAFCSNIRLKKASIFAIKPVSSVRWVARSAPHCKPLNEVGERIASEIADKGAITFARFMEVALYCPICGYYEKEEDIIGRRGDYYTNVSVGGLFGEMLAFQFSEWLEQIHEARPETSRPDPAGTAGGRGEVM